MFLADKTATAWLKSPGPPISNDILYRSQALQRRFERNVSRPRALRDNRVYMPEFDMANAGKHREHGVVYLCGNFAEVCVQVSTYVTGYGSPKEGLQKSEGEDSSEEAGEKNRRKAAYRAAKQVRRLVNTNECRFMWTLTLAPPSDENKINYQCVPLDKQRDYDFVRGLWKGFLRRFRREIKRRFRWILVLELHDSERTSEEKKGTWHLHFATPDRLEWEDIMHYWGHGHVRFDDFQRPKGGVRKHEVRNPGAYMSKYIGKNFEDSSLHRKRYTRSRNTIIPTRVGVDDFLQNYFRVGMEIAYRTERKFVDNEGNSYESINITYKKTDGSIFRDNHTSEKRRAVKSP